MANLSADLNENDGQNEQRAFDRADAVAQREARDADVEYQVSWFTIDPAQEHREFEAGAENMEQYSMRKEAEEMARRESEMEAARPTFREAMQMAKDAMAKNNFGSASGLAWEARCEANTPGQKRLAYALLRAIDRALAARRE